MDTTITTDSVKNILNDIINKLQIVHDDAYSWKSKDSSRRNTLAEDAARNNLSQAKELVLTANGLSQDALYQAINNQYKHAKEWEKKFRDWGGHDNGYAESCHRLAKEAYYDAMARVSMLEPIAVPTTTKDSQSTNTAPETSSKSDNAQYTNMDIDDFIGNLEYDPREILAFNGESITNLVPKSAKRGDNQDYIVITREKRTMASPDFDISVPAAYANITYPGALVLANPELVDGTPSPIIKDRAPIDITVNLPGLTTDNTITVEKATYPKVLAAKNTLLNKWFNEHSANRKIPSNMSYTYHEFKSLEQLALTFNSSVKFLSGKVTLDTNAVSKGEKQYAIVRYKQIFYNVTAQLPSNPSDVFAENVSTSDLINMGIDHDNPPAIVDNVQYGREVYIVLETSHQSLDLQQAASFKMDFGVASTDNSLSVDVKESLDSIKCTVVTLGGHSSPITGLLSEDSFIEKVRAIVGEDVELSANNPAAILSYKVSFLKDSRPAIVKAKTDYVHVESTRHSSGILQLKHTGGYVAKFTITWQERHYDEFGNESQVQKAWSDNGHHKTSPYNTEIRLPGNANNLHLKAQGQTGLVWDMWRTSYSRTIPLTPSIRFHCWGTTLQQGAQHDHEKS